METIFNSWRTNIEICELINIKEQNNSDLSKLDTIINNLEIGDHQLLQPKVILSINQVFEGLFKKCTDIKAYELDFQDIWLSFVRPIILTQYRRTVIIKLSNNTTALTKRKSMLREKTLQTLFTGFLSLIEKIEEYDIQG